MFKGITTLFRLLFIARTLARHDALAFLDERRLIPGRAAAVAVWIARRFSNRRAPGRPGQKLATALTELGPSYIKLGQFLSTRADLLGDELAADLAQLQDKLPAFSGGEARRIIEEELGAPVETLFSAFDDTPVSAASIAQVHFAVTRPDEGDDLEGEQVAVKVLRPGVEERFRQDIGLFYTLAELLERARPSLRRLRPVEVVATFHETVRLEMDLRMEASAACELSDNFAEDPTYDTPDIDWDRTARRVLTMSRLEGIRLDDRVALQAAGHDLEEVLTTAAAIFFNQVFRDGFFHGDQHPGNMFVGEDGRIVAVDFGIMGRLDKNTRYFLADMLVALLDGDYLKLAQAHVQAGYLPPDQPLEVFAQALRSVCQPIMGRDLSDFSFASMLGQMLHLSESFNMSVQPQLLLLQKNMVMAEGISRKLDDSLNLWTLARPLIEEWILANRGPEARLKEGITTLSDSMEKLPRIIDNLEQVTSKLAKGGLSLHEDTIRDFHRESSGTARWALLLALAALAFSVGLAFNLALY